MSSAYAVRLQIESALANKIPCALTPVAKMTRPVVPSGIESLDAVLSGGFLIGAVTEVTGPECPGRTSLAHSFVAGVIESEKVAAWIDVSDTFDPASAAAAGIDLRRLLWVRCGVTNFTVTQQAREFELPEGCLVPAAPKKGVHGGGSGTHPRQKAKGLSHAVSSLLQAEPPSPRCAEPQRKARPAQVTCRAWFYQQGSTRAFSPQLPEAGRLDITLARLCALVGKENVGCPALPDGHTTGSFRVEPFALPSGDCNRQSPASGRWGAQAFNAA
jgi:hypothetical protein